MAFGSIIGPANPSRSVVKCSPPRPTVGLRLPSHRLQLRHRRFLRPRWPGRCIGGGDPLLGGLCRQRRTRGDPAAEPGSPVVDRIPPGVCDFTPFGYDLEGEQHLGRSKSIPSLPSSPTNAVPAGPRVRAAMSARSSSARCRLLGWARPPTTVCRTPIQAISTIRSPSPSPEALGNSDRPATGWPESESTGASATWSNASSSTHGESGSWSGSRSATAISTTASHGCP